MFTDVLYVAYLNSFYFDSAALLGAFVAVPLAIVILTSQAPPSMPLILLFTTSALILGLSKAQHGLIAWTGSVVLFIAAQSLIRRKRIVAVACALLPLIATVYILRSTYEGLRGQATFNVVMFRLLPHSTSPFEMGKEFRLTPAEMKLSGKNAFSPGVLPIDFTGFYYRVFPRLLRWYVFHFRETVYWLYNDLQLWAPRLRFNGGAISISRTENLSGL
jgi:hypothetical protein